MKYHRALRLDPELMGSHLPAFKLATAETDQVTGTLGVVFFQGSDVPCEFFSPRRALLIKAMREWRAFFPWTVSVFLFTSPFIVVCLTIPLLSKPFRFFPTWPDFPYVFSLHAFAQVSVALDRSALFLLRKQFRLVQPETDIVRHQETANELHRCVLFSFFSLVSLYRWHNSSEIPVFSPGSFVVRVLWVTCSRFNRNSVKTWTTKGGYAKNTQASFTDRSTDFWRTFRWKKKLKKGLDVIFFPKKDVWRNPNTFFQICCENRSKKFVDFLRHVHHIVLTTICSSDVFLCVCVCADRGSSLTEIPQLAENTCFTRLCVCETMSQSHHSPQNQKMKKYTFTVFALFSRKL